MRHYSHAHHTLLSEDEQSGDKGDIYRVCKKIMNRAASKRLISKQEASVILGGLPLVLCSDTIENVSISNSKALRVTPDDNKQSSKKFIDDYQHRDVLFEDLSLHYYFLHDRNVKNKGKAKKYVIPNFIGVSGSPCYPVSKNYAKHVLVCYKAWRTYPRNVDWIHEFHQFMNNRNKGAPQIAKIPYERVMLRYINKTTFCDAKASESPKGGLIPPEYQEVIDLYGMHECNDPDFDLNLLKYIDRGLEFNWNKAPKVRPTREFESRSNFNSNQIMFSCFEIRS